MAEDALVKALSFYTDNGQPLPRPSAAHSPVAIVPSLVAAKLALHDAMLAAGISNVVLGRRLGLEDKAVRRLRDPLHRSHIGAVEAALRVLGRRLVVNVAGTAALSARSPAIDITGEPGAFTAPPGSVATVE
jgi:antitoxin HicB